MVNDVLKWTSKMTLPTGDATPGEGLEATATTGVASLRLDEVGVVFQPIVDVTTGRLFAHEALVRCRRREYASPPILFDHAVAENACGRLGRLIRTVAFSTCGDVPLFVNLHPSELAARWLVQPDDPIGFHKQPVYLEVTESATFTHFQICKSMLSELTRRTGAFLVVDDFGAGYSNLERLAELEPAVVKLDLAIVRDIHSHPRKQIVIRHVVSLCKELGAKVVAEGVETLAELRCVRDLGVDFVQGYLLARPAAPPPNHTWEIDAPPPLPSPSHAAKGPPPLPTRRRTSNMTVAASNPREAAPGKTRTPSGKHNRT